MLQNTVPDAQPAPAEDPDWVVQWLQNTAVPDAQPAPADLGWMQSILRQVANQTFLSNFAQDFTFFFLSEQLYIDQDATILIPPTSVTGATQPSGTRSPPSRSAGYSVTTSSRGVTPHSNSSTRLRSRSSRLLTRTCREQDS
ncbi:unnamed protein product [Closterium sp. Yama58-4]|nr:unnamed protein product [Closterium sp. Yama58-4]